MEFEAVLKGGFVVDPLNGVHRQMDVGISKGKIAGLGENLSGDTQWDVTGKTVFPGIIDMHVHVTGMLGGRTGYRMAAATGVTTIIDYAGPMEDITDHLPTSGCGLNVGCLQAVLPGEVGKSPSRTQIRDYLDGALKRGALGLKILGGHYPLSPDASQYCVEEANARRVMVACHAGSTQQKSDIYGLKEAISYSKGHRLLMAHINAYCRGSRYHYLEEMRDAFQMLLDNPNIIADSHMALGNGTSGRCSNGEPEDKITQNCLRMFGYPPTTDGLEQAIRDGLTKVIAVMQQENVLLEGKAALEHWQRGTSPVNVSFPANLPTVAAGCLLERRPGSQEFLIPLAATDGGGFPRNGLLQRLLAYHKLGYLTLDEVIYKCSVHPAQVFALSGKGHLGVGADADITVADLSASAAVMSLAGGKPILLNGEVQGTGGTLITTRAGEALCQGIRLPYKIVDPEMGYFYREVDN